jgi:histidyl-tRNA synthetase
MAPKSERIQPRTLKGFRDFLPESMHAREWLLDTARGVFRSYGFAGIDTPALEYEEILMGKGGEESDKQMYAFEDKGRRRVALRFDLTVPLARFVAQHEHELGMPFKRYHIGCVWRGENTQRGRYREFMQCDFDTIGTESVAADCESALVIHDLMDVIAGGEFIVSVNNRRVLSGYLERLGLADRSAATLRALDKLEKIGAEKVAEELRRAAQATDEEVAGVLALAEISGTREEVLTALAPLVAGSAAGERGVEELREVGAALAAAGIAESRVVFDPKIARGLDYYTGTVFETKLADLPGIGSVCSGGRYDELAGLYTKSHLPGIGASLGVDRLLAALEELGRVERRATPAQVFVPYFSAGRLADYFGLAAELRRGGLAVEVYPEAKKLGAQLKYADRRGHVVAVIVGDAEWESGTCQLKQLGTGESAEVERGQLVDAIHALLA